MNERIANSATSQHNARAWDALAKRKAALTRPARDDDFVDPLRTVDPVGWLGDSIQNLRVLCLAAGGGKHGPLYAAAGGHVTVVDMSGEMLAHDRRVATERGLDLRIVQASMEDLSMFSEGEFDLVIHPVSTCYIPSIALVYEQVARLVRGGGLYISQHKTPTSLQASCQRQTAGYQLTEPYYRRGPLPQDHAPGRIREPGTLEYLHRWEEILGCLCRVGFAIEDVVEPDHADPHALPGTFAHRSLYIAPYIRIKARRQGQSGSQVVVAR